MADIKVYTTKWSADCDHAKRFLEDEGIFYEEVSIDQSAWAARFVERANAGRCILPTFEVNGTVFSLKPFKWEKLQKELERLGLDDE